VRTEAPTSAHPGDAAVVTSDGEVTGWIGGSCAEPLVRREALRALADGQPRLVRILPQDNVVETRSRGAVTVTTTCPSGGALEIFVDPQLPRPLLVVVGGSPAAHALVALGARSGFRTCAVHPGAHATDYPEADLVLSSLELAPARPGPDTWAVVATMGHYDEAALEAVLAHPDIDVGLVVSERRGAAVLENLRQRGMDEPALRRIRAPAGGRRAGRQEQIALLALAEVVTIRNARQESATAQSATEPGLEARFATDPVCGMVVDVAEGGPSATHDGVVVHFCGDFCRRRFLEEPGRFLAELA
jgi:xanthine dehydrogenase accessory factor